MNMMQLMLGNNKTWSDKPSLYRLETFQGFFFKFIGCISKYKTTNHKTNDRKKTLMKLHHTQNHFQSRK